MEEKRFSEAFDMLRASKQLKPAQFCRDLGIHHCVLINAMKQENRHIPVSWFSELCRYGVSAEWLLTGKGSMLKRQLTLL